MTGSAPFDAVEQQLAAYYVPCQCRPQAVRDYTQALVWCLHMLRQYEPLAVSSDSLVRVVMDQWATEFRSADVPAACLGG